MATSKNNTKTIENSSTVSKPIIYVCVLAVGVLLQLAAFGFGGAFGIGARVVLFGLFGIFAYIIPVICVVAFFFLVSNRGNKKAYVKMACSVGVWLFLSVIVELFINGESPIGGVEAFKVGVNEKIGGGFFGGLFSGILVHLFGIIGAYVLAFALLAICAVLITDGIPFEGLMNRPKNKSANKTKVKQAKRKRSAAIDENRENLTRRGKADKVEKEENFNQFTGIMGDTTLVSETPQKSSDEINEVKMDSKDLPDDMADDLSYADSSDVLNNSEDLNDRIVTQVREVNVKSDPDEPLKSFTETSENEIEAPAEPQPMIEIVNNNDVKEASGDLISKNIEKKTTSKRTDNASKNNTESVEDGLNTKDNIVSPAPASTPSNDGEYMLPPIELLSQNKKKGLNAGESPEETKAKLEQVLVNFGVNAKVTDASVGPTVTRYELQPEPGVKVSKIVNLADDIKLNLAAADIRIEAPIPGKAAVGIEVPNKEASVVAFRDLIDSNEFKKEKSSIAFAAGKDIGGKPIIANIAKMPHVLIAGATGSGKSVCINTIIMSILYRAHPDEVKFIMIDPKVVELSVYNGIPHLLTEVVTDPKKAAGALAWAVNEMMKRYETFAECNVRNMEGYNKSVSDPSEKMSQIVVIVDELADLMMVAAKEVEESICRLAQLARAAGIHLVIATQRPSVNVITGLIKANMPSRIAFAVTSGVDSRTILDMTGAEKLLGKGDMLYFPQGLPKPIRVQGAFVPDGDVAKVVDFIKTNNKKVTYSKDITDTIAKQSDIIAEGTIESPQANRDDSRDMYFEEAGRLLIDKEKGSIGMLQRYFKIGFNRAARIMDQLEEAGVVGPEEGTKPRRVLMSAEEFDAAMAPEVTETETEEV